MQLRHGDANLDDELGRILQVRLAIFEKLKTRLLFGVESTWNSSHDRANECTSDFLSCKAKSHLIQGIIGGFFASE